MNQPIIAQRSLVEKYNRLDPTFIKAAVLHDDRANALASSLSEDRAQSLIAEIPPRFLLSACRPLCGLAVGDKECQEQIKHLTKEHPYLILAVVEAAMLGIHQAMKEEQATLAKQQEDLQKVHAALCNTDPKPRPPRPRH